MQNGGYSEGNVQVCTRDGLKLIVAILKDSLLTEFALSRHQLLCPCCNYVKLGLKQESAQVLVGRIGRHAEWTLDQRQMLVPKPFAVHQPSAAGAKDIRVSAHDAAPRPGRFMTKTFSLASPRGHQAWAEKELGSIQSSAESLRREHAAGRRLKKKAKDVTMTVDDIISLVGRR
jgi:hypothetical protein